MLEDTEESYLNDLFGEDNYQLLLDDLVDYSDKPKWDDETTYSEDDIVCYEGEYFVLLVEHNTTSDPPNCNDEWELAPKFEKDCYNEMWNEGRLKKLLSWRIYAEAVPFYPEVLGAAQFTGTDADYKEKINYYLSNIYKRISLMRKLFLRWNDLNGCLTIGLCVDSTADNNKVNRTILGY